MKILIWFLAFSQLVLAQTRPMDPALEAQEKLKRQGQFVNVEISLKEPIKIYVVGREEAQLDLASLTLIVKRLSPGARKTLMTTREGDYFTLTEPLDMKKPTDLEITAKTKGKSEKFRFKVYQKLN